MTSNKNEKQITIRLPFSGFGAIFGNTMGSKEQEPSIHREMLDSAIDSSVDEIDEYGNAIKVISPGALPMGKVMFAYAKAWTNELAREIHIDLKFRELDHMNRIYAEIPLAQIKGLHDTMSGTESEQWKKLVNGTGMFGTSSGIIPHPVIHNRTQARNLDLWGPPETWDNTEGRLDFFFDFKVSPLIDDALLADRVRTTMHDVIREIFLDHGQYSDMDEAIRDYRKKIHDPYHEIIREEHVSGPD